MTDMTTRRLYNTWRRVVRRYVIPLAFLVIPLALIIHALVSTERVRAGAKVWLDGETYQAFVHGILRGDTDPDHWLICSSRVEIEVTRPTLAAGASTNDANVYGFPWHAEQTGEPFCMSFRRSDGTTTGPMRVQWEHGDWHNPAIRWDADGRRLQVLWLGPMAATDLDGRWFVRNTIVHLSKFLFRGVLLAGIITLVLLVISLEPLKRGGRRCEQCGYDLRGLPDVGCPECGWGRGEQNGK